VPGAGGVERVAGRGGGLPGRDGAGVRGKSRVVRDVSAGGVIVRRGPRGCEVALVGRGEPPRWGLPKGTVEAGETLEHAAVREAQEETGLRVRLLRQLGDIQYWFVLRGVRHHKTVHFFLMEAVGGDIEHHDWENDVAAWFPIDEALAVMAFPNEVEIVRRAREACAPAGSPASDSSAAPGARPG